jgi:hypothetical protein
MSDMPMHTQDGAGRSAGGAATLAMLLWVLVTLALVYGLYNTLTQVVDLFTG